MFKCVFVPVDDSLPLKELSLSKEGGLEKDALRLLAEEHFSASGDAIDREAQISEAKAQLASSGVDPSSVDFSNMSRMGSSVEIVTVSVATPANGYNSVVLYCDANRSFKSLRSNVRATRLLQEAGHTEALIHGDCFFGRALDDERIEWERLDFSIEDLNSDASWVRAAKAANAGKNLSAYTSTGALKMIQQQQQHQQNSNSQETGCVKGDESQNEMSWSQTSDEVELRFNVPTSLTSKDIKVVIGAKKLAINVVNSDVTPIPPSFERFVGNGIELYNTVSVGDSTWSLMTEGKDKKVLCVTLSKAVNVTWPTV